MLGRREVDIPSLVRIKPGSLDRVGIYLRRFDCQRVALLSSEGLPASLLQRFKAGLLQQEVELVEDQTIAQASLEEAQRLFVSVTSRVDAIVGLGGGKALDTAKYIGFLKQKPYFAIPTSLSNDGFCSPQSSLTISGKRHSLPSGMPFGVVIDTEICRQAPHILWLSGVGDLVSKVTAVQDWKLAFHHRQTPVDDFAALLSDATVYQFLGRPEDDLEGMRLLATALMLNGIAMSVCGSSRPASGSEHLISHALDSLSARPRLHGLQVGMATYLISHLHRTGPALIGEVFDKIGFFAAIAKDPFSRAEWTQAIEAAPAIKDDFFTILSLEDSRDRLLAIIDQDDRLKGCFVTD